MNVVHAEDIAELFSRVDAVESRQNAIDSRQGRIERLLGDQQTQLQQQAKLLVSLNEKMGGLAELILALAPKTPNGGG